MRLSIGSAAVLGLTDEQVDVLPTTCYILFGERCTNNCAFCTQAKNSTADADKLSRVTWPEFDDELANEKIIDAYADGKIWRVCIQATSGNFLEVLDFIERLNVPVTISIDADENQVDRLIASGAEHITIALDAVTEPIYKKVKGKDDFYEKLNILKNSAAKHPGKIRTHLIAGLGENEKEMTDMIEWMYEHGVNVGLFAFTPVKGTRMENNPAPDIRYYRKIQAEHF
ncbi:radical SAM protein, partial [Candidatus Woesearchaeota archaeon]|nr:radical SAM protein [Candidatus Woesearchaeota archaeon]